MNSKLLIAAALMLFSPDAVFAHDDHDHHVTEAGSIRIVHPWARAAQSGKNTLVFMNIENSGAQDVLVEAKTDAAGEARIVGVTLKDGQAAVQEIGEIEIPAGSFTLDPAGLAVELAGLTKALQKGDEFELELVFKNAGEIHLHVEVEDANARQHGHAGHSH
ncbi:copper chaperone PCu(A)C [Mesorhizobium sp. SB112]|uniref:copper chaperone PCu(A)C n=1 Tax=Mesorhizobium sp. SB112 TaxID=3151853 RepID=UPI003265D352